MNILRFPRATVAGALAVLAVIGLAWALLANAGNSGGGSAQHGRPAAQTRAEGASLPNADGAPCVQGQRISLDWFRSLDRAFPLVTPDDTATKILGSLTTAWTCPGDQGVVLQYPSLQIAEEAGDTIGDSPGGATSYFASMESDGDGTATEIGDYPGFITTPGGLGGQTPNGDVQFVGGGVWIVVSTENSAASGVPDSQSVAKELASQIATGTGMRAADPTAKNTPDQDVGPMPSGSAAPSG